MADYKGPLRRYYAAYTVGFFLFVLVLAVLERFGMPPLWIGYSFLFLTIFLYATIGVLARTASVTEYYVAGRRVPAVFNGMATGADWMSSASFMGLAGVLYLSGYQGLAYVMGWTGGYVLVALLLAPYLRRFGQYTIADFLAARYGGNLARLVGVFATVLASFVYVVAQIYGVGLADAHDHQWAAVRLEDLGRGGDLVGRQRGGGIGLGGAGGSESQELGGHLLDRARQLGRLRGHGRSVVAGCGAAGEVGGRCRWSGPIPRTADGDGAGGFVRSVPRAVDDCRTPAVTWLLSNICSNNYRFLGDLSSANYAR